MHLLTVDKSRFIGTIMRSVSCRNRITPALADASGGRQILRVMKMTAILLIAASLHVSAGSNAQRITLSLKDASLKTVFMERNEQTGYNFLYSDEVLAVAKKVTIDVKDVSIEEVLKLAFK